MKDGQLLRETRYLIFKEQPIQRKTKSISVINKSSGEEIATIEWYGVWKQYCLMPEPFFRTVWNNTCLTDIILILNELMEERNILKPKGY
jgi:hypothetical protein